MNQGRFDDAEPLYIEALRLTEEQVGKEHPDTATILQTLGDAYLHVSRFAEAIPYYQQLLAVGESLLGDSHPNVANVLYKLSKCYDEVGDRHSAISYAGRALDVARRCFPSDHPNLDLLRELYQALMKPASQPFKPQQPSTMPSQGPEAPRASRSQMPSQRSASQNRMAAQNPQVPPQAQQMAPQSQQMAQPLQMAPQPQPSAPQPQQMPQPQQVAPQAQQQVPSTTEQQGARPKRPQGLGQPQPSQVGLPDRGEKARRPQMSSGSSDGYAAPPSLAPRSRTVPQPSAQVEQHPEDLEAQYQSGSFIHPFASSQLTGSHDVQQDLPMPQRGPAPKQIDPSQFNTGSYTHPLNQTEHQRQDETSPMPLNETTSQQFFRNPGSFNFQSEEDEGWHSVGEGQTIEEEEEEEEKEGTDGSNEQPLHTDRDWKNQMMSGWPGHAGKDLADTNNSWIVSDEIRMPSRSERSKSREFESHQYETGSHSLQTSTNKIIARREEGSSEQMINFAKMLKTVLPPLLGFLLLAAIGVFLFKSSTEPKAQTQRPTQPVKATAAQPKATASKTFQSADALITLKMLGPNLCELAIGPERKQLECQTIEGSWHDLPQLILSTLSRREYFYQVTPQGLQTQEGAPVYSLASLDYSVIARMREIAAYVEEYKQVAGPGYPTQTTAPGIAQKLYYSNPFTGKPENAPLVVATVTDESASQGIIEDLERANKRGPESHTAGSINCYAILIPRNKVYVGYKFLVTGCGTNGKMIAGTKFGAPCYVLDASSMNYKDKTIKPPPLVPGMKQGIPNNAVVRIVTQPSMPLFIMHHFLPLVCGVIAILLFWRAQAAPGAATWAPSSADLRTCRSIGLILLLVCIVSATIQALL